MFDAPYLPVYVSSLNVGWDLMKVCFIDYSEFRFRKILTSILAWCNQFSSLYFFNVEIWAFFGRVFFSRLVYRYLEVIVSPRLLGLKPEKASDSTKKNTNRWHSSCLFYYNLDPVYLWDSNYVLRTPSHVSCTHRGVKIIVVTSISNYGCQEGGGSRVRQ